MEADRAANELKAAEAQLRTVQEQIRTARTDLGYYRVTAPTAGIVGDIPVREGDRVTKATKLTSIDANAGLEVYLNVPVQQAAKLRVGLPVRIVDDTGATIAEEKINFVSPSVDEQTQTVLVKTPVSVPGTLRTDQYVRTYVIWTTEPGLTVPVTAVTRINGQWFAFVAEPGEGGKGLVARQRSLELGPVVGNNYTVVSGLKPGEKLISGRDTEDPRRRACAGRRRETERRKGREGFSTHRSRKPLPTPFRESSVMVTDVFIKRPVLATVCSVLITLAGAIAIPTLPIGRYPELAPPTVGVSAFYTGANAQAVESAVTTPLESVINGVEGMVYMTSSSTNNGLSLDHRDVRSRARSRSRGRRRAEPRQLGARTHAARGAHQRHQRHEGLVGLSRAASAFTRTTTSTARSSSATISIATCAMD